MVSVAEKKVNSFEVFKRQNKDNFIIEKCKELMYKNPDLTTKELGKKLGYSDATISRAWDSRTQEEKKQKKSTFDFNKILNLITKGGLGVGAIALLDSEEAREKLLKDIESFLIDNRYLNYAIIGLGIVWEKFVKVKIKEGNTSEIEVLMRITESNFSYVILIVLAIMFLIPRISDAVKGGISWSKFGAKEFHEQITTKIAEDIAEVQDFLNTDRITIENETFPSFAVWLQSKPQYISQLSTGYALYIREKRNFKDRKERERIAAQQTILDENEREYRQSSGTQEFG